MKKHIKYYLILAGLVVAVIGGAAAFYFNKTGNSKDTAGVKADLEAVSKNINGINVMIDPRMELLAAVQFTSNYDSKYNLLTKENFTYKKDMKDYFLSFSNHKAVTTFDNMSSGGFSYDAPPAAMLYLSNPLDLTLKQSFSSELDSRAGEGSLKNFISDLQKFAADTKFDEFYNKHKEFYKSVIEKNSSLIGDERYTDIIEQYYGMKQNSYNLILSPMFHSGGFGPRVSSKDGSYDIYSIQGTHFVENDIPIFGDSSGFRYIALHEFSHSFVNPLAEENRSELDKYSKLYGPISYKMGSQAYTNWETCVNEHIVRAVVARLTYEHSGKEAYDSIINLEKINGFFYIEALSKKLEEYEKSRGKYKTFQDFYPELITVFKELSEQSLGKDFYTVKFNGPINRVFQMGNPVTVILPTNEKDEELKQDIEVYLKEFWKKSTVKLDIITDKEALNADLKNNSIVAYGTIEGNLYLKKYKDKIPFIIEKDRITGDKEYGGTDLRLITAVPSPTNEDNGMIICTAQRAEGIKGIHDSIRAGENDYVIGDGKVEITSGFYKKESEKWSFK